MPTVAYQLQYASIPSIPVCLSAARTHAMRHQFHAPPLVYLLPWAFHIYLGRKGSGQPARKDNDKLWKIWHPPRRCPSHHSTQRVGGEAATTNEKNPTQLIIYSSFYFLSAASIPASNRPYFLVVLPSLRRFPVIAAILRAILYSIIASTKYQRNSHSWDEICVTIFLLFTSPVPRPKPHSYEFLLSYICRYMASLVCT